MFGDWSTAYDGLTPRIRDASGAEAIEFAVVRIVSLVPSDRAANPEAGPPLLQVQLQQLDVFVPNFVTVILKSQIARASEVFYRSRLTV